MVPTPPLNDESGKEERYHYGWFIETEVPPPAFDGTGSAIPSSGLDVLFNKKGEDDPEELPTEEELTEWKKLVFPSS